MSRPYKLLILGYDPGTLERSTCSFHFLTWMMKQNFTRLLHVEVHSLNLLHKEEKSGFYLFPYVKQETSLPRVDFVLIISFPVKMTKKQVRLIKRKTKAIRVVSLGEHSFDSLEMEHSFVFDPAHANKPRTQFISLPYAKSLLSPTPKTKHTVLLDHYWRAFLNSERDWTSRIQDWVEQIKDTHTIYRLVKFPEEMPSLRSFEVPITESDYVTYLQATSHIENFVVTHRETYAYSVIDMAARGAKVMAPQGFLYPFIVDKLNIPVFSNQEELLGLIDQSWVHETDAYTDHHEVACILDREFQRWMLF